MVVNEKEKDFMVDVTKFLDLKYMIDIRKFRDEILPDETAEAFLYRRLDKFILKNLYTIGVEDYKVDFSFEQFLNALVEGYSSSRRFVRRRWFWDRHYEPSKYQKKPHHQKKEKTIDEINKDLWRKHKKKRTTRFSEWRYDYEWEMKKHENDIKKEAFEDLKDFLDENDIGIKGLRLSL